MQRSRGRASADNIVELLLTYLLTVQYGYPYRQQYTLSIVTLSIVRIECGRSPHAHEAARSHQKYSTSSYSRDGDLSAPGAAEGEAVTGCRAGEREAAPSVTGALLAAMAGAAAAPVAG